MLAQLVRGEGTSAWVQDRPSLKSTPRCALGLAAFSPFGELYVLTGSEEEIWWPNEVRRPSSAISEDHFAEMSGED